MSYPNEFQMFLSWLPRGAMRPGSQVTIDRRPSHITFHLMPAWPGVRYVCGACIRAEPNVEEYIHQFSTGTFPDSHTEKQENLPPKALGQMADHARDHQRIGEWMTEQMQ